MFCGVGKTQWLWTWHCSDVVGSELASALHVCNQFHHHSPSGTVYSSVVRDSSSNLQDIEFR